MFNLCNGFSRNRCQYVENSSLKIKYKNLNYAMNLCHCQFISDSSKFCQNCKRYLPSGTYVIVMTYCYNWKNLWLGISIKKKNEWFFPYYNTIKDFYVPTSIKNTKLLVKLANNNIWGNILMSSWINWGKFLFDVDALF
jgi:hypothetical protein